jgi:nitrogen regulatory protein PII
MKQLIAIVRPYLAELVLESLRLAPLEALQVTEVKGFGRQKSYLDQYLATEYSLAFLPKVEITLYIDDTRLEEVLKTIIDTTRSGRMGDGKIMILDVAEGLY